MTRRWTTRPTRTVAATRGLSGTARRACAAFGLVADPRRNPACTSQPEETASHLARAIVDTDGARVILITGPSGSGKTSVLRALHPLSARVGSIRDAEASAPSPGTAVFDAVARSGRGIGRPFGTTRVFSALSSAGLAEPAIWARPCEVLSTGESARLRLACAMIGAAQGDLVLCDEFASNLDRVSAGSLARTAARWARRAGVTLVAATAHEDMPALLGPDLIVHTTNARVERVSDADRSAGAIRCEPGEFADFAALARFHYLGGRPATVCRVLRAVRSTHVGEVLAGVLVVSMPTFNGIWRRQAWPGRYDGVPKQTGVRRLNEELRCISRVIVDPRSRGLGIASALVRAYLREPVTPATEAIAAMGGVSPFFRVAGMTEYKLPRLAHDARLSDAIAHAGVGPEDLLTARAQSAPFIRRELERWARQARVRINETDPLPAIARHAVCRLASSPRAYASGADHAPSHANAT
ncbi:MAG: hypothetical protein AAGA55_11125 [Planctomycetota bacterium]